MVRAQVDGVVGEAVDSNWIQEETIYNKFSISDGTGLPLCGMRSWISMDGRFGLNTGQYPVKGGDEYIPLFQLHERLGGAQRIHYLRLPVDALEPILELYGTSPPTNCRGEWEEMKKEMNASNII